MPPWPSSLLWRLKIRRRSSLQAHASLDGKTFAEAHFPRNFEVPHQRAYTVLDSSTHAVNLFVATETQDDRQYGSIFKSNSNGTSYVLSVDRVNCDSDYFVDFEKMLGLEGVALVNIVSNPDQSGPKKLQSKITHNDGATWAYLPPPMLTSTRRASAAATPRAARTALCIFMAIRSESITATPTRLRAPWA